MIATLSTRNISAAQPGASAATQRASAPPSPEAVFQKLDSGGKGYLTADDLQSAIVAISPQGAQLSAQDAAAAAQAELGRIDGDQDGQVSVQEFVQAGPPEAPPAAAASGADGRRAAGARPAHPADGGGARGGGGAGATAGTSSTYEPADANRDGKVTQPEQQAYDQTHPTQAQAQAARSVGAVAKAVANPA